MSENNSNGVGINNLRDIGGKKTSENKTIKKSLFLRCAAPTEWNDSIKNQILGLKKPLIIDFRGVQEEKNNPSSIPKEFLRRKKISTSNNQGETKEVLKAIWAVFREKSLQPHWVS